MLRYCTLRSLISDAIAIVAIAGRRLQRVERYVGMQRRLTFQPINFRMKTSSTNATQTHPANVLAQVRSAAIVYSGHPR